MAPIPRRADDFVIVNRSTEAADGARVAMFAVTGPGLNPDGIPFRSYAEAEQRGREIARTSRVALWCETGLGAREGMLVASFRNVARR